MFKRAALGVLWCTSAISGAAIVMRAFHGPLLQMHSPMNAESAFALSTILLLLIRSVSEVIAAEPPRLDVTLDACAAAALLALTAAAFWRILGFYFLSDDFILIKQANGQFFPGAVFTTGGGDGFFRPAGHVSLAVTAWWASANSTIWHGTALAWHAANTLLVFVLALQTGFRRLAAFAAAAVFAVHGSRPEAVAWIASQFDRVSAFFLLCGIILFIRSRSKTKGRILYVSVSLICMAVAVLCKEAAYVFPLLLVAWMMSAAARGHRRDLSRYKVLIPYFALAMLLFIYRWILLSGMGGYRDVHVRLVPSIKALLLRIWAVLFFPVNWSVQPGWALSLVLAVAILCFWRFSAVRTGRSMLCFALAFVVISALPPLELILIGADLQKARLLYLPSIGFCLLLGAALERLPHGLKWPALAGLIVFQLVALDHNLDRWSSAAAITKKACAAAENGTGPEQRKIVVSGLPGSLDGVYVFANGFPECVEMQRKTGSPPLEVVTQEISCSDENSCANFLWDVSTRELRPARFMEPAEGRH